MNAGMLPMPDVAFQLPFEPWSPPDPKYRSSANTFAIYESDNDLGIPVVLPEVWIPKRLAAHRDPARYGSDAAIHFFIDDYRFEPVWRNPAKYVETFAECGAVLTPDFSVYSDWPLALQIWQVYRTRWLGAHLQRLGLRVIPSVSWASPADFYYYGLPHRSVLAVASTGVRGRPDGPRYFRAGLMRLADLEPEAVLVYGGLEGLGIDDLPFPVVEYPSFLDERRNIMEGVD